jgi:hypothetical protein
MARAFVIRPFDKKKDATGREFDFEAIHEQVIGPALEAAGLAGSTTGEVIDSGNIREDMCSRSSWRPTSSSVTSRCSMRTSSTSWASGRRYGEGARSSSSTSAPPTPRRSIC